MFEPAKFLLDRRANERMIYAICSPNSSIVMDPKLDLLEPWPKPENNGIKSFLEKHFCFLDQIFSTDIY
jgi:hypothetical protein